MAMHSQDELLRLIRLVYDGVGRTGGWQEFLKALGSALSTMASRVYIKPRPFRAAPDEADICSFGLELEWYRSYHDYYGRKNPAIVSSESRLEEGSAYTDEELYPRRRLVRTEFYNDWIRPQKMAYALYGVAAIEKSGIVLVNSVRGPGVPGFDDEDLIFMKFLLPHLRQAVRLHEKLTELQAREEAAGQALNCSPMGVMLIDWDGKVRLMNRSAETITDQGDGLRVSTDGLHATAAEQTLALRSLISDAARVSAGHGLHPGGVLSLRRSSGKRPLNVLVAPTCSSEHLGEWRGAAAIVLISDPETVEETHEDRLVRLFFLSRAEARVAARVAQGKSVREISDELCISLNTVRTHLKRILDKTDTHRQTELVRLVLRSPASAQVSLVRAPAGLPLKRSA